MSFRRSGGAAAAAVALLTLTACTSQPTTGSFSDAPHAGAYPVATAGSNVIKTASVRQGGYVLVAAGDPVNVDFHHAELVLTMAGPDVEVPHPAPGEPIRTASAPGTITVTAVAVRGSTTIASSQFLGLDQQQSKVALSTDHTSATVSPSHPVTLRLHSQFASGHTTLTWQPTGKPLITWDFTIEID